jgi:hypothetical protein
MKSNCGCSHSKCNKTPKGKMCPKHGMDDCTMKESRDPKGPVKSYKSPEELAKKHKVSLNKIMQQVKVGTKVEGEHTTSKSGAKITALQHVDERPDYYTQLKKVEKKKVTEGNLHQWFKSSRSKDEKPGWVNVVTGGTCASDEPGEGTPKCVSSSKRSSMTKAERLSASKRKKAADPGQQSKSGAAKPTYVSTDKPKKMNEESDVKGKSSGKKDACYHKVRSRYDVWPSAYASGALVKCRKAGAKNWGNKSEEFFPEDHKEVASGKKKDEEGYMSRIEFDQIERSINVLRKIIKKPDQQIPAWVQSKITRAADFIDTAAEYMSSDEEVSEACWKGYTAKGMKKKGGRLVPNCVKEVLDQRQISEEPKFIHSAGQTYSIMLNFRSKIISVKLFFANQQRPTKEEVQAAIEKIYPGALLMYYAPAINDPSKPYIVATEDSECQYMLFPSEDEKRRKNYLLNIGVIGEDWQKVNRQDKTDGLSQAAVNAYRRENPGSKLKTAVTEKNPSGKRASRRKSFCSRMSGMKSKLTSSKTANDPDSRINKALRRWNCS